MVTTDKTWISFLRLPAKFERELASLATHKQPLVFSSQIIKELNEENTPPLTRFAVLEKLIFSEILQNYYKTKSCKANHLLAYAGELQNLNQQILYAYNLVVAELLEKESLRQQKSILVTALERTIYFFGLLLLQYYESYKIPPDRVWYGLHQFYAYAELQNIAENSVISVYSNNYTTIANSYKLILLTVLADPYHLDAGEVRCLYHYLQNWTEGVGSAKIVRPKEFDQNYNFYIDLESDDKVMANVSLTNALIASEQHRVIDLENFINKLKEHLQDLHNGKTPAYMDQSTGFTNIAVNDLLTKALGAWERNLQRQHIRQPIDDCKLDIIVGFQNLCKHLQQSFDLKDEHIKSSSILSLQHRGYVQDSSPAGICLTLNNIVNNTHLLRINQLILINTVCDTTKPPKWRLASIRWLQELGDNNYRFGSEYLGDNYIPAKISLLDLPDVQQMALIILAKDSKSNQNILITPVGTYATKRILQVNIGLRSFKVKITDMIQSQSDYEQFNFQIDQE